METLKTEITEYNATRAGLADITKRMKDVVYDLTTASGMEAAKLDRRELISLRTNLESMRVVEKAPVLKRGKAIDAEAKLIEVEIRALEKPIDAQIKAVEKIAKEKKEKLQNEAREKTRLIMERIEKLRSLPERISHQTAAKLIEAIESVQATPVDEKNFGEYLVLAQEAFNETMVVLIRLKDERVLEEKEAAQKEEQRLAEVEAERIRQADAQLILDKEKEELRIEREKFETQQADAQKVIDAAKKVEDDKQKVLDDEKRVKDETEKKRLADLAVENENKRKKAEADKKISDRAARVAQAKCVSAGDAFQKILDIVNHEEMGNETKLDDIQVIAEANI